VLIEVLGNFSIAISAESEARKYQLLKIVGYWIADEILQDLVSIFIPMFLSVDVRALEEVIIRFCMSST